MSDLVDKIVYLKNLHELMTRVNRRRAGRRARRRAGRKAMVGQKTSSSSYEINRVNHIELTLSGENIAEMLKHFMKMQKKMLKKVRLPSFIYDSYHKH